MVTDLDQHQTRVLGCLIEKQLTTPDYYPLTLSGLVTACNQKSNREPVMSLSENDVLDAIHGLSECHLAREKRVPHGRVAKYEHKLSGTLTQQYDFSQAELAVLAVLFNRGPQTPGELRSRTNRMHTFTTLDEVDATLRSLTEGKQEAFVKPLARQPGRREIRYTQLFSEHKLGDEDNQLVNSKNENGAFNTESSTADRTISEISSLRAEVAELRGELSGLKSMVDELING